ncbi:MAG: polymer-forming cytoskeletal protein [Patescibacteria group bacterium]
MENNVDTIIGINVILKGNLRNKGSIQINGTVDGEVKSDENINIGETAKINGPVVAKTIEISGEVKGLVEATERLEVNPTGKVFGDINAKSLIIKQGAKFIGKSIMPSSGNTEVAKTEIKPEGTKKEISVDEKAEDKFGFFGKK